MNNLLFRVLLLSLAAEIIISVVTGYILAKANIAAHVSLIYLSLGGSSFLVLSVLPLAIMCKHSAFQLFLDQKIKVLYVLTVLALSYFLLWWFCGILAGQHLKDVTGGVARAMIPFIVILVGIYAFRIPDPKLIYRAARLLFLLLIVFFFVRAAGKIVLLSQGVIYGGGLNQFSGSGLFITWLMLLTIKSRGNFNKMIYLCFSVVTIFLTIISLKRSVMVALALNLLAVWLLFTGYQRVRYVIVTFVGASAIFLGFLFSGYGSQVIDRVTYTFHNNWAGKEFFDPSTQIRISEVEGALKTLQDSPLGLGWLVGMGPGAGYRALDTDLKNTNELGEPYHIHSFWGIVGFRFGILGLLFYIAFPLLCTLLVKDLLRIMRRSKILEPFHPAIIGISAFFGILDLGVRTISSNAYYGNFVAGILVIVLVASSSVARSAPAITALNYSKR